MRLEDEETYAVSALTRSSKARASKTGPTTTEVWQIATKLLTAKVLTPLPPVNQGKYFRWLEYALSNTNKSICLCLTEF